MTILIFYAIMWFIAMFAFCIYFKVTQGYVDIDVVMFSFLMGMVWPLSATIGIVYFIFNIDYSILGELISDAWDFAKWCFKHLRLFLKSKGI